MSNRKLKKEIFSLIKSSSLQSLEKEIEQYPVMSLVNVFFSGMVSNDERIRWFSVKIMGKLIALKAEENIYEARIIMRRLLWSLMEESGSIGWGAPEVIAESIARSRIIRDEYLNIFISLMDPKGNYLEFELLQRGVIWGVARIGEENRNFLLEHNVMEFFPAYLESADLYVLAYATVAAELLKVKENLPGLCRLLPNNEIVNLFLGTDFVQKKLGDLASKAIEGIEKN